jgi:dTDP-4-amino-4,6-dideoxygalactose transaminase
VPELGTTNCWLTCVVIDPAHSGGVTRHTVSALLSSLDIESRPLWKPMHLQPIFAEAAYVGRGISDRLFDTGLCLPSGSNLSDRDLDYIISSVISCWPGAHQ